jgi:DNA polymerase-3 subunit gamma/tau
MEHPMENGGLMSYLVLARKWRPKRFAELVGQEHVVRALSNALDSGRVHHAFLFTGTRGVGKTTIARIFAKSLNCEQGTSADPAASARPAWTSTPAATSTCWKSTPRPTPVWMTCAR